jgi:hypothetical protein
MNSGADATKAAELASATLANHLARAAASAKQMSEYAKQEAAYAQAAAQQDAQNYSNYLSASNTPGMIGGGNTGSYQSVGSFGSSTDWGFGGGGGAASLSNVGYAEMQANQYLRQQADTLSRITASSTVNDIISAGGSIDAALAAAKGLKDNSTAVNLGRSNYYLGLSPDITAKGGITQSDIASTVAQLYQLKNAQAGDDNAAKIANDQEFLAWLQTQPQTIATMQQMASLTNEIKSLSQATNDNTKALTSLLVTPGTMTAWADPLLHTELMAGGDAEKYAAYFYKNPTTPPANTNQPTTQTTSVSPTVSAPMVDRPVIIQVQAGVQADSFIASRAQIQRAMR